MYTRKHKLFFFSLIIIILVSSQSFTKEISNDSYQLSIRKPTSQPLATLININNITMWAQADGILGYNPHPKDVNNLWPTWWGVIYPRGKAGVVYSDGIIWGGMVKDGNDPELRAGGQRWISGTVPGCIISKGVAEDPNDPDVRIWRIRTDWQTADLTQDAAEFFNVSIDSVTPEQIDAIRSQYQKDWNEWPWHKGAPFYDTNGNGILDSGEEPGLAYADQVVWFVANDLDSVKTKEFLGLPSIGLEMQVTLWAYNRTGCPLAEAFQHIIFKRVRLIYKGRADTPDTAHIDSMFIAQFAETDLGHPMDNLLGCDMTWQLSYCYNGYGTDSEYHKFNLAPPAIGYALIQGPIVFSNNPLSEAYFDFSTRHGFINLAMSSFWPKYTGTPWMDPQNALRMYRALNGFLPFEDQLLPFEDLNGNPTRFPFSGDPVAGTGHLDGLGTSIFSLAPGVRRFMMNSGPFRMALADTQEVIIAIVGGMGSDRLASISVMKYYVKWAQCWAQSVFQSGPEGALTEKTSFEQEPLPKDYRLYQNFPNPFNAGTEIRYDLPIQQNVKLSLYNLLGQLVKVLVNEQQDAGIYTIRWDGTNGRDENVPTGIYLYRIEAGHFVRMRKMMLLR